MHRALFIALAPLLLLAAPRDGRTPRPMIERHWTIWNEPICPGGRVPITPNVRLDQIRGGEFVAAGTPLDANRGVQPPTGPTREKPGVCLGLASRK